MLDHFAKHASIITHQLRSTVSQFKLRRLNADCREMSFIFFVGHHRSLSAINAFPNPFRTNRSCSQISHHVDEYL